MSVGRLSGLQGTHFQKVSQREIDRGTSMSRTEDLGRLRGEIQAGRRDRMEFVANLTRTVAAIRKTVAGRRKRFMDENRAAHAAWFGPARAEEAKAILLKEAAAKAALMQEEAKAVLMKEEAEAARKERKNPSRKGREEKPSKKGRGR